MGWRSAAQPSPDFTYAGLDTDGAGQAWALSQAPSQPNIVTRLFKKKDLKIIHLKYSEKI